MDQRHDALAQMQTHLVKLPQRFLSNLQQLPRSPATRGGKSLLCQEPLECVASPPSLCVRHRRADLSPGEAPVLVQVPVPVGPVG